MINNNFYIITGGPGAGKTTLIKELKRYQFETIDENARKIIKEQMASGGEGLPWKNKELYAKLMVEASLKSYQKASEKNTYSPTFFDRGILDAICYMKMEKIPISNDVKRCVKQHLYNSCVFLLPPWKEIYKSDKERKQNWEEAELTYTKMKETYLEYNYRIIEIPKMTAKERAQFIIHTINN